MAETGEERPEKAAKPFVERYVVNAPPSVKIQSVPDASQRRSRITLEGKETSEERYARRRPFLPIRSSPSPSVPIQREPSGVVAVDVTAARASKTEAAQKHKRQSRNDRKRFILCKDSQKLIQ
jgi:hypothetical protein